ncbi:MAG: UDPglucose--hexose-phosphate uridylyltransferase [Chloroflexota bacterium]|nr:UDPglucose--hexose-phosphate uridylyltransferase [Chloroflexota bacterium]
MPADGNGTRSALARLAGAPHRRYNPLTDEWVLVSAGRTRRPWLGAEEPDQERAGLAYDPNCYLCPGNTRANGNVNPPYPDTYVFTNDFSALRPDTSLAAFDDGLLRAEGERGSCRVVCFSPRHDLTLGKMAPDAVRHVIDLWAEQTAELGTEYRWVQVFENRGEAMGASNPHPHGQIWAGTALPGAGGREDATQRAHFDATARQMLLEYVDRESGGQRVIVETDAWLIVVPFWATWPFETMVIPKRAAPRLTELDDAARDDLAIVLHELIARYDGLFKRPFPYSMGWHQAPFGEGSADHWQVHAHFYPPLLRANVRKFMVGYELLAETQRDLTAEDAAGRLRAVNVATTPAPEPAPIATATEALPHPA